MSIYIPTAITIVAILLSIFWPRGPRPYSNGGVGSGIVHLFGLVGQAVRIVLAIIVTLIAWLVYFIVV